MGREVVRDQNGQAPGQWGEAFRAENYVRTNQANTANGWLQLNSGIYVPPARMGSGSAANTVLGWGTPNAAWVDRRTAGPDIKLEGVLQTRAKTVNLTGNGLSGAYTALTDTLDIDFDPSLSGALPRPKGHLASEIPHLRSHWRCLDGILGGTSLPDELGNHAGTGGAAFTAVGRPEGHWDEGQIWLSQGNTVTLGNTASLLTALRDTSCAFMGIFRIANITSDITAFQFAGAGETEANNFIFGANVLATGLMRIFWESGAGTDRSVSSTHAIAPGMRHLCWFREHGTGSGTSTGHLLIDGDLNKSTSGITSPTGGSGSAGSLMVAGAFYAMTDAVLLSGAGLTLATVQAACRSSWLRMQGVY